MERALTWIFVALVALAIAVIAFVSLWKGVSVAGLSIATLLGLATLVFVLAGRARRAEAEISAAKPHGILGLRWRPSARDRRVFLAAVGSVFYALALVHWVQPERTSGRFAWLLNWLYDSLGPLAPAAFFALIGTLLIAGAFLRANESPSEAASSFSRE